MATIADSWTSCVFLFARSKRLGYVNPKCDLITAFEKETADALCASRGEENPGGPWCQVMIDGEGSCVLPCRWVYVDGLTWDLVHIAPKRRAPPAPIRSPKRAAPPPPLKRRG